MLTKIKYVLLVAFFAFFDGYAGFFLEPEVHYFEGRVEKQLQSTLKWEGISLKETILHNTKFRTFTNSQIQLQYNDNWYVSIGDEASIDYLFSRGHKQERHQVSFSLQDGESFFHFPYCATCPSTFFSWNLGSYFVKGESAIVLIQNSPKDKFLFLYEGSLQLSQKGKQYLLKAPVFVDLRGNKPLILNKKLPDHKYKLWVAPEVKKQKLNQYSSRRKALATFVEVTHDAAKTNWDLPKLFKEWLGTYLFDHDVLNYQMDQIQELAKADSIYKTFLNLNVTDFDIYSNQKQWSFRVRVEAKLFNRKSNIIEDSWVFDKTYTGKTDDETDLQLLKYLPLNASNQKFDESFFKEFWKDFTQETLLRAIDPLYEPQSAKIQGLDGSGEFHPNDW